MIFFVSQVDGPITEGRGKGKHMDHTQANLFAFIVLPMSVLFILAVLFWSNFLELIKDTN